MEPVFPGADNRFTLYEDSGDGPTHRGVTTTMELRWGREAVFLLEGAKGDLSLIPSRRRWHIDFRGFGKDVRLQILQNGEPVPAKTSRDAEHNTVTVEIDGAVTDDIQIRITGECLIHDNSDVFSRCVDVLQLSQIRFDEKSHIANVISNDALSLHKKLYEITGRSEESQSVVGVIRELLTLTEDEYLGKESN